MESSYPADYGTVSTPELERLYVAAARPDEKQAIEQELNRRYRYNEPAGQRQASGRARPEPGYRQPPRPSYWSTSRAKRGTGNVNTLAIVSLVLSVLWICWLGSIAGLIIGFLALKQINTSNQSGRGFAMAGIIISGLSLALIFLLIISQ
jgi:hypothetical protein